MAKVSWAGMLQLVLPELPKCIDDFAIPAMAATLADFCERSRIWRVDMDAETTIAGEPEYALSAAEIIFAADQIWLDGQPLNHWDFASVPGDLRGKTGKPLGFVFSDQQRLTLYPTPDGAYTLTGTLTLRPSRSSTLNGLESWIFERYADVLADGTIARLADVPGKDWTNHPLAAARRASYERGIDAAKLGAFRHVRLRTMPPPL